ncbi:MAG TPA: hypothetical protein VMG12_18115 [Polyangiaceae bacterium]|nr:hypothetical protein [Polyangiaceae bacterium]
MKIEAMHAGQERCWLPENAARRGFAASLLGALAALGAGCSSDAATVLDQPPDTGQPATSPAVLVGVIAESPEGRNIYVGAEPEVPTGALDTSRYIEFGNVDVSTHGGAIFVWDRDPATLTQLIVGDDLSIAPGPTLSFANYGAAGGQPVYISDTRAYLLSAALDVIVVWNPSSMEITGSIPLPPPERASNFTDIFAHNPIVVGDSVIWQINSNDWDTPAVYPAATLAIMSATRDEPWRFVEDDRCAGTDGASVDERGDYYVRAGAYWGYFAAFGAEAASVKTCVLRLRAGETEFDPDYQVDLRDLTGSYINFPWFHVQGSQYVAQSWDTTRTLPADPGEFWSSQLVPQLVDIETRTAQPYPDLDGTVMVQSSEYRVDGVSYYELNPEGYTIGGEPSRIVELRPEGVVDRFTVDGLWALARIR